MKALTDLEICRRIAEIEGEEIAGVGEHNVYIKCQPSLLGNTQYNPLADDALCFQLMVKYGVERVYEPYDFIGWHCRCINSGDKITLERTYFGEGEETPDLTPNKTMCLAIIEANKV